MKNKYLKNISEKNGVVFNFCKSLCCLIVKFPHLLINLLCYHVTQPLGNPTVSLRESGSENTKQGLRAILKTALAS